MIEKRGAHPFWAHFKVQVKTEYGLKNLQEKLGLGTKGKNGYIYMGLLALAMFPMMTLFFKMAQTLSSQAIFIGERGIPMVLAIILGQGVTLFMGVSGIMSSLYYSDDLEALKAMPLTAREIMAGKLFTAYLGQVFISFLFLGPYFLGAGLEMGGMSLIFWFNTLIVYLAIPGLPLALSLLLVALLMKFTSKSKKRESLRVVLGLLFFAAVIAFQVFSTSLTGYGTQEILEALSKPDGLLSLMVRRYPLLGWGANALVGNPPSQMMKSLLMFFSFSLGSLFLSLEIGQRFFLEGMETGGVRTVGKEDEGSAFSESKPPFWAILLKEHKVMIRTSNFLLTVLINLTIAPLLLLVSSFTGSFSLGELKPLLEMSHIKGLIPLAAAGIHGATVAMNQVASTGLSREGSGFWMSKVIPVTPKEQVKGKLIYSLFYALIQLLILLLTVSFLLELTAYQIFIIVILSLGVSWPVSVIALMNDIQNPRLSWTNPQSAMKGNLMTLVSAVLGWFYLVATGLLIKLLLNFGVSYPALYIISGAIVLVSGYFLNQGLYALSSKKYSSLEV